MEKIQVTLEDGSVKIVNKGIKASEILSEMGDLLAGDVIAVKANSQIIDLSQLIHEDCSLKVVSVNCPEGQEIVRHSSAHVLAMAITSIFPEAKPTIGPPLEDSFYYDFDVEGLGATQIEAIEQKMREIVAADIPFERLEVSKAKALEIFKDNAYKQELIDEIEDEQVSLYKTGDFVDLCRGPHVPSTGKLGVIKILNIAGAYWRGDAHNKQLQRIYGVNFKNESQLKEFLWQHEEAKKRDHRKLGRELDLFMLPEEGQGFPLWCPNGMVIYNALISSHLRPEHEKRGYKELRTPVILDSRLWKTSGHWEHYKENMFLTKVDGQDYAVKPMNCPGSILYYKSAPRSYRDLPLKLMEFGHVHRKEQSGVLHGLLRVRAFTQDDAHIYIEEDKIREQIIELLELVDVIYRPFGFDYEIALSTRPEEAMGEPQLWEKAETALQEALDTSGKEYKINEGAGAFYGPKIDFKVTDCIGRKWQCGTIQLDFFMPERFELEYIGNDGQRHKPVMIHRAILGSIERFIGILIEHYAGNFPLWLSPVQVIVIPIADRHLEYATEVSEQLRAAGLRCDIELKSEPLAARIRRAQFRKPNYILVIGDNEVHEKVVAVRRSAGKVIKNVKIENLLERLFGEIRDKT